MYSKILLTTDGSGTATAASKIGAAMAGSMGAQVLLLHVGEQQHGRTVLDQTAAALGEDVRTVSVQGDPADKILEVAENEGVDLIVVGNKGMTGAKRFLLGSVPNHVSHHAPCDVFIVKTT